jgi:hypothetical protein
MDDRSIWSKPHPEFQSLCAKIRRNDASLTIVQTNRAACDMVRSGYGRRFSAAFSDGNSVVTELDLNLAHFLSPAECNNGTTKAAEPLLQWIRTTHSLKTVKFSCSTRRQRHHPHVHEALDPTERLLVERILQAMAQSASIQTVETHLLTNPVPMWTTYLSSESAATHLQSLRIVVERTSRENGEALARAIGALVNLQVLEHRGAFGGLMLQQLVSHAALRDLTVNLHFMRASAAAAAAASSNRMDVLCCVLSTCTRLESVTLTSLDLLDETWPLIAAALQSNPSKIANLKLNGCHLSKKAWSLLTRYFRENCGFWGCNASSLNTPRRPFKLHLIHCRFTLPNGTTSAHETIGQMLRGSKLEHLTVDLPTLSQRFGDALPRDIEIGELHRFCTAMSKASSSNKASSAETQPIQLPSLQLDGLECRDLPHLSRYLSSTTHLRHLRVEARRTNFLCVHDHWFLLPRGFLAILRRNGSLESVEIRDVKHKQLRPGNSRVMEAIATRNRLLPQLLPAAFLEKDVTGNGNDANHGAPAQRSAASAKKRLSVTLCQAAQQAPRMAPNNVLKGLLAARDNSIGSTTSSCGSKRVASG